MNSHYNPEHFRYRTPEQWHGVIKRINAWWSRVRRVVLLTNDKAGSIIEARAKRGGRCFYRVETVDAIKRPRKRKEGVLERETTGLRMVRVDYQGERLPRARKMKPGMSGKSFVRAFRKELRAEKAAANRT